MDGRKIFAAALLLAAVVYAGDYITISEPAPGATFQPGKVVQIKWRNATTLPVKVELVWPGHHTPLGEGNPSSDGAIMWRVPAVEEGEYKIVVENEVGARAEVAVLIARDAADASPAIYATPNPLDLSAGRATLTIAGAPAGAKVTIFDLEGREVRVLTGDPPTWDGRNAAGDLVAGGTYLFVCENPGGGKVTGKIAVVK